MNKKALSRIIMSLMLVLMFLVGSSTTAFAKISGVETWSKRSDESDYFTVTNNNLTQRKTIGFDGIYYIWVDFHQADSANYPPVMLTVEVRNLTTGVTTISDFSAASDISHYPITQTGRKGDVIQIFFDVKTERGYTPPGPYRKASIKYGYSLDYGSWF